MTTASTLAAYIQNAGSPRDLALVQAGRAAPIYLGEQHQRGVDLAVADLAADIEKVTGARPEVVEDPERLDEPAILVGTLGSSPVIDALAESGKIDVSEIRDVWEAYLIAVVEDPMPGVDRALVIAGSNRRGTIFGIYDLSENLGVSPWYFWADVAPQKREAAWIPAGTRIVERPDVKFRGIWINDNHLHQYWSRVHIDKGVNFGPRWAGLLAELLLRLKANYMWVPAPPGDFYKEPMMENFQVLDERGIWVGSAHNKQLQRDNLWDWQEWAPANIPGVEPGLDKQEYWKYYNFATHPQYLKKYWEERVRQIADLDIVWSVGLRGVGDRPMIAGDASPRDRAELVEDAIEAQREILRRYVSEDVESIPQTLVLYKEVLELEETGALQIPEDVTVVQTDNNKGWVRDFPTPAERARPGGHGIYNHISYIGPTGTYLWLNSTPVSQLWHDMDRGFRSGVRDLWILNSGDIKPGELGVDFFLSLAWDADRWNVDNLRDYHVQWARREFGSEDAEAIADLLLTYFEYTIAQRPEWVRSSATIPEGFTMNPGWVKAEATFPDRFSMIAYGDEAQRRTDQFAALLDQAQQLHDALPEARQPAFYQLVLFPIHQTAMTWRQQLAVAKAQRAAELGLAGIKEFLETAEEARAAIRRWTDVYNDELSAGKWKHILWGGHVDLPEISQDLPKAAELNVLVEGMAEPNADLVLDFSAITRQPQFLEIVNGGREPFTYTIDHSAVWLVPSVRQGELRTRQRLTLDIDWKALPVGDATARLSVTGAGRTIPVTVRVENPELLEALAAHPDAFVEGGGAVSLEAEHFAGARDQGERHWRRIDHLGLSGAVMKSYPDTDPYVIAPEMAPTEAAMLVYPIWFTSTGEFSVTLYLRPNLPHEKDDIAVALDDGAPRLARVISNSMEEYLSQRRRKEVTITVAEPGLHVLKVYAMAPAVLLDKIVIDTGGVLPSFFGPPESPRASVVMRSRTH